MKTQLLKTTIIAAVATSLVACGDKSSSSSEGSGQPQEKELTGKPLTADEMAAQTYRLKTDKQELVLKKLGHLVWTKFNCKAELKEGEVTKTSDVQVTFYPNFEVTATSAGKTNSLVSADEICGSKLDLAGTKVIPTGSLQKDDKNQYVLQYGAGDQDLASISMTWDAANTTPGELICKNSEGKAARALLKNCELVANPNAEELETETANANANAAAATPAQ